MKTYFTNVLNTLGGFDIFDIKCHINEYYKTLLNYIIKKNKFLVLATSDFINYWTSKHKQ